ncbi:nuclear pore complex protein Nup88 [Metopolophium dirhodum]|uniref:nuclear pore complex protein Nup88 n=1 Tax=Metopolophium dirhodum TaxID=44670 RepID=UPI0029903302|nr:nuclear pore complex protein Nup88 [Metopolophium dirhodum]
MPSITDMLNLNKLEMFQTMRKILETDGANTIRNLIAYKDQILYIWNPDECCLYSLLLNTVHEEQPSYQKLFPVSPPLFDVDEILINEPGTLCALVGSKGVSVMRFPKRMGSKSLYDTSGSQGEGITCSTSLLQDKFFITKHLTDVKRVRWYPGSPEDNHLVVLTNNKNCLRLFKVDKGTGKLVSIWRLGPQTSRILASLGDTAVDFDFAPPVLLGSRIQSDPSIMWPILVLQGNGDVLCMNTTVDDSMNIKSAKITGPLTMYPPADDNYSEDACSILVMDTIPPSVVIASNFGELYNCLLLPDTQAKNEDEYEPSEYQHEYSLHIIETIELELGLNIEDNGEYDSSNTIQLKRDAAVTSRYWCLHNTGVHSVTVPLSELLDEFSKTNPDDFRGSPDIQGQSFVEYYICTGLMNGETKPIKGFAILSFPTDLLVTLLSNGEVVTQAVPDFHYNKLSIANMYTNEDNPASEDQVDSSENVDKDDFSSFISALLQKENGTRNTILKLGPDVPKEIVVQMVLQTMNMRRGTLNNHKIVSEEIERRVRMLAKAKERQLQEMQRLEEARKKLQDDVENKAEKLDEISNKQEKLTQRASSMLLRLVSAAPDSISIKKKRELLDAYKTKMDLMNKRIEEARDKWNIVQSESAAAVYKQLYGGRSLKLTLEQELVIKGNLSEMGSTILDLERKVRDLRTVINTIAS